MCSKRIEPSRPFPQSHVMIYLTESETYTRFLAKVNPEEYGDRLRETLILKKNEVTRDKFAQIDYDIRDIVIETMVLRDKAAEACSEERVRQQRQITQKPAAWWN